MKNATIIPRTLNIIVGIVFLSSGLAKLVDVSAFQLLIVQYGFPFFQYLAPLIILLELLLAMALVLGIWRRFASVASVCMLLFFTAAYTYGYLVNDVEDCGCFGNIVKSTPAMTYIRNVLLIVMSATSVWLDKNPPSTVPQWKVIVLLSVMLPSVFCAGMTFRIIGHHSKSSHPFEGKAIADTPLIDYVETDGNRKLVLFMSYKCQHCWNSIENFKAYEENGFVDTVICYALCATAQTQTDSAALLFQRAYPEVNCKEVMKSNAPFIDATPTAFFIKDNRVDKIVVGGLPSPFLLFPSE